MPIIIKTEKNKNLLRELKELEMALMTAFGPEADMLTTRRDAVLALLVPHDEKKNAA